jgi:hypothetical protein
MAASNDPCHIGDDIDTLTVMNDDPVIDVSSSNDARDVSQVRRDFSQELITSRSTFGT